MQIILCENGPFMVNTYLVYDENAMKGFIIDPGSDIGPLLDHCDGNRITVESIIATHTHIDHIAGVGEVQRRYGIPFYCSEREKDFIKNVSVQARMFGVKDPGIPEIDRFLPDSGSMTLSGFELQLFHTPGHSPGSIGLYWPAMKALFPGDVIFQMNVGRSDFPGGDSKLLKESIRSLSTLDVEYLLPGHMGMVTGRANVKKNFEKVIEGIFPYL